MALLDNPVSEDQLEKLTELFANLKDILPKQKPHVRERATAFLNYGLRLKDANERYQAMPVRGTARALEELELLENSLLKVRSQIDSLSLDAAQAALDSRMRIYDFLHHLDDTMLPDVKRAQTILRKEKAVPPPKGRRKNYEKQITSWAIDTYHALTGKELGRSVDAITGKPSGALLSFVSGIFDILSIKASPGNMIRQVSARAKGVEND